MDSAPSMWAPVMILLSVMLRRLRRCCHGDSLRMTRPIPSSVMLPLKSPLWTNMIFIISRIILNVSPVTKCGILKLLQSSFMADSLKRAFIKTSPERTSLSFHDFHFRNFVSRKQCYVTLCWIPKFFCVYYVNYGFQDIFFFVKFLFWREIWNKIIRLFGYLSFKINLHFVI